MIKNLNNWFDAAEESKIAETSVKPTTAKKQRQFYSFQVYIMQFDMFNQLYRWSFYVPF